MLSESSLRKYLFVNDVFFFLNHSVEEGRERERERGGGGGGGEREMRNNDIK